MKRTIVLLSIVWLVLAVSELAAQTTSPHDDLAAFQQKVEQKAAQMKANGASEQEIQQFLQEANKKYEAKLAAKQTDMELKKKLEHKIQQMKAEGATEEQIKEAILAFKHAHTGQSSSKSEWKLKMEQKIQEMKAAGATEAEIEATIKAFKQKMAEQEYDEQKVIVKKKEQPTS
mgnify:CR=1 FL=1